MQRRPLRPLAVAIHQGDIVVDPGAAALRDELHLTPRRPIAALGGEEEAARVPVQGRGDRGQACADTSPALLEGRALGVTAGDRGLDGLANELERTGGRRVQFAQVLPCVVKRDTAMQPLDEVSVQRGLGWQCVAQEIELAKGAGCEVGAGLVALRAVVGKPVDVLLASLDDRRARVEASHVAQEPTREVLDHGSMLSTGWSRREIR